MDENQTIIKTKKQLPAPNPVTQKLHRKEMWLQVVLPLCLSLVVIAGLAVWFIHSEVGDFNAWAQISMILLMLPFMIISLLLFALLVSAIVVVTYVLKTIPPYARVTQDAIDKIRQQAVAGADISAKPIIQIRSFLAMIGVLLGRK